MLTQPSVSKAAVRLGVHQLAVISALKRLRHFAGNPLLVRADSLMVPNDAASLLQPGTLQIPARVASTLLLLTTGRQYCERVVAAH